MIKKILLLFVLILWLEGCTRVNINPSSSYDEIQKDVSKITGYNAYWDSSIGKNIKSLSIKRLLKKELSEDFCVRIALLNNQNLQAIYQNLGIAKADLTQASLLNNPIFSFSDRFSTNSSVTDLIDLSLLQNVLEILLIPLKKKMAKAELQASKSMITTRILEVIADTKIAFYTLQAAKKIQSLQKEILLAKELSYEAAKRLFEAGNITELEMCIERSSFEQEKLGVASVEIEVLEAREKLNVLMGLYGRQINWEVSSCITEVPEVEKDFSNIENKAIANSIDLKIAYQKLLTIAAGFGIDTTRYIFPRFDVGISAERDESVWFVGPVFNFALPFFDQGHANAAKAQATILQHWKQYTALAVEIRSRARSFRFTLMNAFRQSKYMKKVIVPLAEEITFSTLEQHNAMQLGVFHLLLAKQRELEKKIQCVQLQRNYWISKIELLTLLNGHILYKTL